MRFFEMQYYGFQFGNVGRIVSVSALNDDNIVARYEEKPI